MSIIIYKNTIKLLSVLALISTVSFAQNVSANESEAACKAHIQGKIAWDPNSGYETAQKWEEANLESLCKGTKNPEEPGKCFHHVMTGHVKWGSTDKWDWKNAIALCAATDNSDQRIACFEGRVKSGEKWDTAVFQCQSNNGGGGLNNKIPK